jgi:hypothetical protein
MEIWREKETRETEREKKIKTNNWEESKIEKKSREIENRERKRLEKEIIERESVCVCE